MSFDLKIEHKTGYLHAIVTGQNSPENVAGYFAATLDVCEAASCSRVLIEERLEGPRLNMLDVFATVSEGSAHSFGKMDAIAYVDVNAEGDLMQFAETVAVNRALPARVFSTVAQAEEWLQR